jgi:hypothetical protein
MISIKGTNANCSVQKLFEDEESSKAMDYYRELASEGLAVQYTRLKDKTVKEYTEDLNARVKKILNPSA